MFYFLHPNTQPKNEREDDMARKKRARPPYISSECGHCRFWEDRRGAGKCHCFGGAHIHTDEDGRRCEDFEPMGNYDCTGLIAGNTGVWGL